MDRISKEEMNYLISKSIITQKHGNFGESLKVTGKFGKGRGKQRFVTPFVYSNLTKLQEKDKYESVDLDKVKFNQKYLFSNYNSECVL